MQYSAFADGYMVYVEKNEKIMDTLTEFCLGMDVQNAQLSGIGAVKGIELGAYDVASKEYIRQHFEDTWELVSYQGNDTLKDGRPFIHAHVTISDHSMRTRGGHLFEATVSAVGEFFLRRVDSSVHRKLDEDIGLPTWCTTDHKE